MDTADGVAEETFRRAVAAIVEVEVHLAALLDRATWVTAADAAEEVERLARAVQRLQIRVAGAVEATSPARSGTDGDAGPAPYRRGCDLMRTRVRISGCAPGCASAARRHAGGSAPPLLCCPGPA